MKKIILGMTFAFLIFLNPIMAFSETIDVLIKGIYDGSKTSRDRAYKEAVMNAKLAAIERAGVEITSFTKVENFTLKYDMVESKAKALLLPGFQVIDMGYQADGTYQVVLSGKVQVGEKKPQEGKLWGKLRPDPIRFRNFTEAFESWANLFPNKIENQFVNNEDGSISDLKTGLMWQFSYQMTETIKKTNDYVAQLNKNKFAGHSDWRIPTFAELSSLIKNKPSAKLDSGRESYLDPLFDTQQYCWYLWSGDSSPEGNLLVYVGERNSGITIAGDHYQADNICVACIKAVRSLK